MEISYGCPLQIRHIHEGILRNSRIRNKWRQNNLSTCRRGEGVRFLFGPHAVNKSHVKFSRETEIV